MTRPSLFLLLCLSCFQFATAQSQWGVKLNVGASKVANDMQIPYTTVQPLWVPSGQGGVYFEKPVGKVGLFGAEVLLSYVQGKTRFESPLTQSGGVFTGVKREWSSYDLFYLSVPLWYGLCLDKWTVNAGIQASLFLYGDSWTKEGVDEWGPGNPLEGGVIPIDAGPRVALFYSLSQRMQLEANAYYGLTNTVKYPFESKSNAQQILLGLRYMI